MPTKSTAQQPSPFSVLLPVYDGDHVEFFVRAFESVTKDQILKPNEVVIVRDGPVRPELQSAIDEVISLCTIPTVKVELEVNSGLAMALNHGLAQAAHEVVARADSDDISLPHRFQTQLALLDQGFDLVGSAIVEFETDERETGIVRAQPVDHKDIARYSRFHDPFNHPTVIYRKSAVQRAGGYEDLDLLEDYLLFARMIHAGVPTANSPDGLVLYRVGAGAYSRRGGMRLLKSEIKLQKLFRKERFTSTAQFLRNLGLRGGYRLVPERIRRIGYRKILLKTGNRPEVNN